MISSFVRALVSAFKARRELALENVAVVSKNTNELKTGTPGRVFGLEVSRLGSPMEAKMRRSSFGDAGWADHAVPDVQGHLRVHPTSLFMVFADTGKPTDTSIQTRRSNT